MAAKIFPDVLSNQRHCIETSVAVQSFNWEGQEVTVISALKAGASLLSGLDHLGRGVITIGCIFATLAASVAVGIATLSLQNVMTTLIVGGICSAAVYAYIYFRHPKL